MIKTGIILAGGKSSRMGQDKALIALNGKPMIAHVFAALSQECDQIIVASNNPTHAKFGTACVKDVFENSGPLGGIHAGLLAAKNDCALVLSCDTPFITNVLLQRLWKCYKGNVVVARCNGKKHPLVGVYPKSIVPELESALTAGQFRATDFLKQVDAQWIDFGHESMGAFENINTIKELETWREK